jgi:hypothetical protein
MALHRLPDPAACLLWTEPTRLTSLAFETVVAFDEEDGFQRRLVCCPECGQLYLSETNATAHYLIPVPTAEHAAALALASHAALMRVRPVLYREPDAPIDWARIAS